QESKGNEARHPAPRTARNVGRILPIKKTVARPSARITINPGLIPLVPHILYEMRRPVRARISILAITMAAAMVVSAAAQDALPAPKKTPPPNTIGFRPADGQPSVTNPP